MNHFFYDRVTLKVPDEFFTEKRKIINAWFIIMVANML